MEIETSLHEVEMSEENIPVFLKPASGPACVQNEERVKNMEVAAFAANV